MKRILHLPNINVNKQSKIFFLLAFLFNSILTFSQEVPFSIRYQDQFKGDIVYVSNNNLSEHPTNNFNDANGSNDFAIQVHVDIDSDANTFNSSAADLSIPANCTNITFAGLYWSGTYPYETGNVDGNGDPIAGCSDCNRYNTFNNIKFKLPGAANYLDLVGNVIYDELDQELNSNQDIYVCFYDVIRLIIVNATFT